MHMLACWCILLRIVRMLHLCFGEATYNQDAFVNQVSKGTSVCLNYGSCDNDFIENKASLVCGHDASCHKIIATNISTINCTGAVSCNDMIVSNCDTVFCMGYHSCQNATIINAKKVVCGDSTCSNMNGINTKELICTNSDACLNAVSVIYNTNLTTNSITCTNPQLEPLKFNHECHDNNNYNYNINNINIDINNFDSQKFNWFFRNQSMNVNIIDTYAQAYVWFRQGAGQKGMKLTFGNNSNSKNNKTQFPVTNRLKHKTSQNNTIVIQLVNPPQTGYNDIYMQHNPGLFIACVGKNILCLINVCKITRKQLYCKHESDCIIQSYTLPETIENFPLNKRQCFVWYSIAIPCLFVSIIQLLLILFAEYVRNTIAVCEKMFAASQCGISAIDWTHSQSSPLNRKYRVKFSTEPFTTVEKMRKDLFPLNKFSHFSLIMIENYKNNSNIYSMRNTRLNVNVRSVDNIVKNDIFYKTFENELQRLIKGVCDEYIDYGIQLPNDIIDMIIQFSYTPKQCTFVSCFFYCIKIFREWQSYYWYFVTMISQYQDLLIGLMMISQVIIFNIHSKYKNDNYYSYFNNYAFINLDRRWDAIFATLVTNCFAFNFFGIWKLNTICKMSHMREINLGTKLSLKINHVLEKIQKRQKLVTEFFKAAYLCAAFFVILNHVHVYAMIWQAGSFLDDAGKILTILMTIPFQCLVFVCVQKIVNVWINRLKQQMSIAKYREWFWVWVIIETIVILSILVLGNVLVYGITRFQVFGAISLKRGNGIVNGGPKQNFGIRIIDFILNQEEYMHSNKYCSNNGWTLFQNSGDWRSHLLWIGWWVI